MTGDTTDIVRRLRAVLPTGWFGDATPVLDTLLSAVAQAWTSVYHAVTYASDQARIRTASGPWLDAIASDFFGRRLRRRSEESDDAFRMRIMRDLLRERGTRNAIRQALSDLTGREPVIFEPAFSQDTGSYGGGHPLPIAPGHALAYGVAGGWGSLALPFQVFVTAYRPIRPAGAGVTGWGTGGYNLGQSVYSDLQSTRGVVTDADICATVSRVLPVSTVAWTRIAP
jgi:hypothetical protein